jgi:hypothetical protein
MTTFPRSTVMLSNICGPGAFASPEVPTGPLTSSVMRPPALGSVGSASRSRQSRVSPVRFSAGSGPNDDVVTK